MTETHSCLECDQEDNHPKVHVMYGKNPSTGKADWAHLHHDCTEDTPWHDKLMEDESFVAIREKALDGVRGDALRDHITAEGDEG